MVSGLAVLRPNSGYLYVEIMPTIVNWQDIAFQWFAAAILGTGGLVGKILKGKDRRVFF